MSFTDRSRSEDLSQYWGFRHGSVLDCVLTVWGTRLSVMSMLLTNQVLLIGGRRIYIYIKCRQYYSPSTIHLVVVIPDI